MSTTPTLSETIALAHTAHSGQTDKAGEPYINHPLGVADLVFGLKRKTIAILHDVVEDTSVTLDDLHALGYPADVIVCVDALTRRDGETLEQYVARILEEASGDALAVKLADIAHNAERLGNLDEITARRLTRKYERTAVLLDTTLEHILTTHRRPVVEF